MVRLRSSGALTFLAMILKKAWGVLNFELNASRNTVVESENTVFEVRGSGRVGVIWVFVELVLNSEGTVTCDEKWLI